MKTLINFFEGLGVTMGLLFASMLFYLLWGWLYKKPKFKKAADLIWKYLGPVLDAILTPLITLAVILWVIYMFIAMLLGAEPQM